eukprot:1971967-Pyramimonas_sp.AAC.1
MRKRFLDRLDKYVPEIHVIFSLRNGFHGWDAQRSRATTLQEALHPTSSRSGSNAWVSTVCPVRLTPTGRSARSNVLLKPSRKHWTRSTR